MFVDYWRLTVCQDSNILLCLILTPCEISISDYRWGNWNPEKSTASKMKQNLNLHLLWILFFFFFPYPQHAEILGPGIEPAPWQWPEPQQWQCQVLNPQHHQGTPVVDSYRNLQIWIYLFKIDNKNTLPQNFKTIAFLTLSSWSHSCSENFFWTVNLSEKYISHHDPVHLRVFTFICK